MRTVQDGAAVPARFLRRALASATAMLLLGISSANAGTVLIFAQYNSADVVTATTNAVTHVTTLSTAGNPDGIGGSIPVYISSYDGTTYFPPLLAYETFVGVHSTGAATSSGGTISQTYAGEVEFLNATGTVDYLTATFTNAVFSGSGFSASLNATAPNLTFSSNVSTFGPNTGMSIAFSGISPGLSETGGVLRGFTAQNAGDFSTSAIPEPSTLCLSAIAVIAGAAVARSRKKMKDRK